MGLYAVFGPADMAQGRTPLAEALPAKYGLFPVSNPALPGFGSTDAEPCGFGCLLVGARYYDIFY